MDQGERGFDLATLGVAGFFAEGDIDDEPRYETFAAVIDEKVMVYNTVTPPPPILVKCRFKKAEVY